MNNKTKIIKTEVVIKVPESFDELKVNSAIEEMINQIPDFEVVAFDGYEDNGEN